MFYKPFYSEYIDSYLYKESIAWKGTDIPYFQCENNMPNTADLRALLQTVMNAKPGLVIAIGGGSILANLIDKMIPVLTYGTTGNLQETMTSCQTLSGKLEEAELQLLDRMGMKETSIIPIQPKVNPDMQKSVVTRKELKLPENKFIVAVAGNRLDSEIDESFMQMLERVLDEDMAAAVIGTRFHSYEKYMQMMPGLRNKVQYLGYSADLLAWLEVCDVYVNPYRVGGGVSATDALLKGLPVITMDYGDVAVCAGKEFCTESYDTMPDLIRKYKDDAKFYQKMSILAKERAQTLIDAPEELQSIIEEFQRITSGDLSISGEKSMINFNEPICLENAFGYVREAIHNKKLSGDGEFTRRCSFWLKRWSGILKGEVFLTTSCTHAIEMAAMLADIQPGDEVIMPSYTFVSTANAFVLRGARIRFVDIRPDTMDIDEQKVEAAVSGRTRAIVPVHYAGVGCEMDVIMDIAKRYHLTVIEDAAQGVMSTYKGRALGAIGDYGCYRFHETKNYSMGEGGCIAVKDEKRNIHSYRKHLSMAYLFWI